MHCCWPTQQSSCTRQMEHQQTAGAFVGCYLACVPIFPLLCHMLELLCPCDRAAAVSLWVGRVCMLCRPHCVCFECIRPVSAVCVKPQNTKSNAHARSPEGTPVVIFRLLSYCLLTPICVCTFPFVLFSPASCSTLLFSQRFDRHTVLDGAMHVRD